MHTCIVVPASAVGSAAGTAAAAAAAVVTAADRCPGRHGFPFVVVTV